MPDDCRQTPYMVNSTNLIFYQQEIQGEITMRNIFIGFVLGLVVATVGFSGIARIADRGIQTIQEQSKELAQ